MTYCCAIKTHAGMVFLSDSRTNAGVDSISTYRKMLIYERPGDRFMVMLSAGNLSIAQSVREILQNESVRDSETGDPITIWNARSMFEAARVLGAAVRHINRRDGEALRESGLEFNVSLIFGGQIKGEEPRLFQIYSAGNFIEATKDTPFFQIGEHKYGKPILDRVTRSDMRLGEAAKLVLLSFDSTLRSNLSVGMPIDLLLYNTDSYTLKRQKRIHKDDPYFQTLSSAWSNALRKAFTEIEEFEI